MQPKIVFLDALSMGKCDLKEKLEKIGEYVEYPTTSKEETLERCKGFEIVLTNKVVLDADILKSLKDLKLICITATGTNNVDLEVAKELGIIVKNVAGYSTKSVAQHTLMMALALSAKMPFYDRHCKSGDYARGPLFTELSYPLEILEGKRWGIIGLGTIGKAVAKLAQAFGAEVCYYSTSGKNANGDYLQVDLETLLKTSTIVSIHAPLNPQTQNLLNKNNLKFIKDNGILINVGRGGIVNEEDLASELKKRPLYAGLDVFTKEPMALNNALLDLSIANQLVLTPHNAWGYEESKKILIEGIMKNIQKYLA
ncbi:MAG: D-2-hydroxyacid dehydrogenase [Helicobacter sp.]|nr:D-2-hydroxyacid dehydrogenase [Helicobacter sp.]